jgi:hypothetical protein
MTIATALVGSVTLAVVTCTACGSPLLSMAICRFMPHTFLPASYPFSLASSVFLTLWTSRTRKLVFSVQPLFVRTTPTHFFRLSPEDVADHLAPRSLSGRRRELSATSESLLAASGTSNHSSRRRALHRSPRTSRGFVVSCVCGQTRVWAVSSQIAPMLHNWVRFFVPSVCFSLPGENYMSGDRF